MMIKKIYRDERGQGAIEALYVILVLYVVFTMIINFGFYVYDRAIISYNASTAAVNAAIVGQFNEAVRANLAQNISNYTINGKDYSYDIFGSSEPDSFEDNTVYIWGTDKDTPVQKGNYINVNVSYPWRFKFFIIDDLNIFSTRENYHRITLDFSFPSEVYFEY